VEPYHYLDGLDAEYDQQLERAIAEGDTEAYTRWLGRHWLKACQSGHRLCEDFDDAIREVAAEHEIALEHATPQGLRA
jgi:hypothetical protein